MTWVIKAGKNDPTDPPHYLSGWDDTKLVGDPGRMDWSPAQGFAHRFADRNEAVRVATSFPICAYDDEVRIVKLTPTGMAKSLAETNRRMALLERKSVLDFAALALARAASAAPGSSPCASGGAK